MERAEDAASLLSWLGDRPAEEGVTGYAPDGWEASTWILHAMYENPALERLGTHDELHRRRLNAGEIEPLIIGDVNLDEATSVVGTPLGFVIKPGRPWRRVRWGDYLARTPEFHGDRSYPPSDRWFPHASWPVAVEPPPEASLDEESLGALLDTLAAQSPSGDAIRCYAFYAALPASDFDTVHLWQGPLSAVPELIQDNGGPYQCSPTNLWPLDRSWFVWTDWDLQATRVSGTRTLIDAIRATPALETIEWSSSMTNCDPTTQQG
ncbi:hypothetical protein HC028_14285 [Planosporangium flavigriseum]|nr:hypothetical protein [Planosporangium flavigriseum]NJC65657.1 hypothetical protein [Planosporangium flavigriseum]